MSRFLIQRIAGYRIDDIYVYTRDQWGEAQAAQYVKGLFTRFESISAREFPWRTIPAELGVSGFVCKYQRHFIYWKVLEDGAIGITTILHERMHQIARLKEDLA